MAMWPLYRVVFTNAVLNATKAPLGMFEILYFLFENYYSGSEPPDPDILAVKLSAAGFDSDDIEYTVDWLKGLLTTEPLLTPTLLETSRGFRVFAPIEAEAISAEVQGFLLFLEQSEVLTASQRERVIERITACQDTEMPLEKVKLIVLMVLWAEQQTPDDLWLTELLLPADALPLQ